MRVGIFPEWFNDAAPLIKERSEQVVAFLKSRGATVVPIQVSCVINVVAFCSGSYSISFLFLDSVQKSLSFLLLYYILFRILFFLLVIYLLFACAYKIDSPPAADEYGARNEDQHRVCVGLGHPLPQLS